MRHTVHRAEFVHQPCAFDAVDRLERACGIVEAGVNHLAVVRARRHPRPGLLLEDANAVAALRNRERRGQSDHAAADHGGIDLFHLAFSVRVFGLQSPVFGRPETEGRRP